MDDIKNGPTRFRILEWEVDPSTNRVACGPHAVKLEPKVMDVLVYLASRPGQTVSRMELEDSVWTDTIVGYEAVTGAIRKLRKVFDDNPTDPQFIETLSKKGYRLIAPVTVVEHTSRLEQKDESLPLSNRHQRSILIAIFSVLVLVVAVVFLWINKSPPINADRADVKAKIVAVLPFRNLSTDPAQDYFAEGLSDDLITSLSRFSDLQVIARDSTIFYKNTENTPAELADKLNIDYLVQGGVGREEDRLRIRVNLADSHTGEILWSERFDDQASHLFELQDKLIHKIVVALTGRMNVRDRQELSRPRTKDLEAYDYFLYGRQQFFLYANAADNRQARESFQRAVAIDPEFAMAYAMLAWTHAFDAMNGWTETRRQSLEKAKTLAQKAIEIDEAMPVAYFVRGLAFRELGDRTRALVEAEKAIAYDPNYAGAHVLSATLLYFNGKPQESVNLLKKAIALNPHHPFNYSFHLAQAYFILHRYDEAIESLNKVLETNPSVERAHLWLAAAYGQTGRLDDAAWEVEQVLTTNPQFSLAKVRNAYPFADPEDLEHFISGLRKAGFSD